MIPAYIGAAALVLVAGAELAAFALARAFRFPRIPEFPPVTPELVRKFRNFDPELGWVPQPSTVKRDTPHSGPDDAPGAEVTYTTDELGGRTCEGQPSGAGHVATFGDSYCFCREVGDTETWQHFLAGELGARVSNYGVGNYGLDQAVLRLERDLPRDPAACVVMAITPQTIERILAVWKHYSEFGNVLAAKPRFRLEGGALRLVESPVRTPAEFLQLRAKADWLRVNDHHHPYFVLRQSRFPYLLSALRNPARTRSACWRLVLRAVGKRLGSRARDVIGRRREAAVSAFRDQRQAYHRDLYAEHEDLFCALVRRFVERARALHAAPVLAMLPNYDQIRFMRAEGTYYGAALARARRESPELEVIDFFEEWAGTEDLAPLFVRPTGSSHHSPAGNRAVAEILARRLRPIVERVQRSTLAAG